MREFGWIGSDQSWSGLSAILKRIITMAMIQPVLKKAEPISHHHHHNITLGILLCRVVALFGKFSGCVPGAGDCTWAGGTNADGIG